MLVLAKPVDLNRLAKLSRVEVGGIVFDLELLQNVFRIHRFWTTLDKLLYLASKREEIVKKLQAPRVVVVVPQDGGILPHQSFSIHPYSPSFLPPEVVYYVIKVSFQRSNINFLLLQEEPQSIYQFLCFERRLM